MMFRTACVIASAVAWAMAEELPLVWRPPEGFDAAKPHLGLPVLTGATHRVLYAPLPSEAEKTGQYESLLHGLYNHHQSFIRSGEWLIVQWTNHLLDENGPGQRVLAKVGRIAADGADIDWGGDETLSELCPPAQPVRRRRAADDNPVIDSVFLSGGVEALEDGRLFVNVRLKVCDGWTDDVRYHDGAGLTQPVPQDSYRTQAGWDEAHKRRFRWDLYWHVGRFMREATIDASGAITPVGPLYAVGPPAVAELKVTPTVTKPLLPLNEPYRSALPLERAPPEVREAYAKGRRVPPSGRSPRYAPGTSKLAANGKNGLAHHTEYARPDGKWVAVRDNLLDPTTYYAAVKDARDGVYPPAGKTNLFGTAMPVAGELPSGAVWLIGSNAPRTEAYLALSSRGVVFDRSWSFMSVNHRATPGVCKGDGGAQYFQSVTVGPFIWVVYSIAKEQVGLARIPVALLERLAAE